jgi:hypothetical protein
VDITRRRGDENQAKYALPYDSHARSAFFSVITAKAEKLNMQGESEGAWGLISLRTLMTCIPTPPTITRGSISRFFGWAKPPSLGTLMGRLMTHRGNLLSVWVLCSTFSYLSLGMDDR